MVYGIVKYTKTGKVVALPKTYIRYDTAYSVLKTLENRKTEQGFRFSVVAISATGSKET